MITNFLSTQGVGSTLPESSPQSKPTRNTGASFEDVMRGAPKEAAKTAPNERDSVLPATGETEETPQSVAVDPEAETTETEEALSLTGAPLGEDDAGLSEEEDALETEVVFIATEGPAPSDQSLIPKHLVASDQAAAPAAVADGEPVIGAPDQLVKGRAPARAEAPTPAALAAAEATQQTANGPTNAGLTATSEAQPSEADLSEALAAAGAAQDEAELPSEEGLLQQKAVLLEATNQRKGISTVLEAHRDVLREQRAGLETSQQTTASKAEAQVAEAAFEARSRRDGEAETPLLRETTQTVAAPVATPQPNKPQVSGAVRAAGSSVPLQSVATGAEQTSSSAVVTSIMAAGEAAVTGENVLTQRGFDSIALPQLIAEASVRSGAATYRAETPRHVAQQLAEAVATAGRRNVEVSLNPVELGRVSMRLATHDTGVTVVIQAERPETEELMRRHIQDLAREFKEMGFTDISFQFGSDARADSSESGSSEGQGQGPLSAGDGDALAAEETILPIAKQLNTAASGLDMRV